MNAFGHASARFVVMTALIAGAPPASFAVDHAAKPDPVVDANGKLHVPDGYRTGYQYLGTWAVAKDQGAGSEELHVVYASPGTIDAYRKTGQFQDGAVLLKEVFVASTAPMTTGTVSHADTLRGWFVMVRDDKGRHGQNDVWGDGWGWSWFDAGNPTTASRNLPVKSGIPQPTLNYRNNCIACHTPAKATSWVFIEGYPPLKR
jgi:hypothetical protein